MGYNSSIVTALCLLLVVTTNGETGLEPFVGFYKPTSNVDNYAIIDLDIQAVLARTSLGTQEGFDDATTLYEFGAFAFSFAQLEIVGSS